MVGIVSAGVMFLVRPADSLPRGLPGDHPPIPPYNWVSPLSGQPTSKALAGGEALSLPLTTPQSVGTPDGQAELALDPESFAGQQGASVTITVMPADPNAIAKAPQGLAFRSNAYEITVSLLPSRAPVTRLVSTQLALEFVGDGDRILYWSGSTWDPLPTSLVTSDLVASTNVGTTGTYVVAGQVSSPTGGGRSWLVIVAIAGVVVIAVLVVGFGVLFRRRGAN